MADRAQERLHTKYWRLVLRSKAHHVAVTAVARELVGFIWAVLCHGGRGSEVAPQKTSMREYVLKERKARKESGKNVGRRRCA